MSSFGGNVRTAIFVAAAVLQIAAARPMAVDPLFGIKFDPRVTHFAGPPADLLQTCPALVTARWGRQMYLFAESTSSDAEVLMIGGYFEQKGQASGPSLITDDKGALVIRSKGACKLVGPVREVFEYHTDDVPQQVLAALATDAHTRYLDAFGGAEKFATVLRESGHACLHDAPILARVFGGDLDTRSNAGCRS